MDNIYCRRKNYRLEGKGGFHLAAMVLTPGLLVAKPEREREKGSGEEM